MTAIFDTHAHYDDDAFNEDREQLLAALPEQGIARVVEDVYKRQLLYGTDHEFILLCGKCACPGECHYDRMVHGCGKI